MLVIISSGQFFFDKFYKDRIIFFKNLKEFFMKLFFVFLILFSFYSYGIGHSFHREAEEYREMKQDPKKKKLNLSC